jgi:DNA methylase
MQMWDIFKATMPHQQFPYSKRNWGSSLHSVCSYQAKMKPSLAHHLVATFSKQGDVVLDPFSGSGTIPFEACLTGRKGLGMDISLLSTVISNAKLMRASPAKVEAIINDLAEWIKTKKPSTKTLAEVEEVKFNGPLKEYFHPDTFTEILSAREFFASKYDESAEYSLVMACMLHILHGNRPYALSRNSHPITPYAPTGEFEYKSVIEKLSTKVGKSLNSQSPPRFVEGKCYKADICKSWPAELQNINAIITSPPFFDSTKFYMTNWMRFWFCGWSKENFSAEPESFVEIAQKKSMDIYSGIFSKCKERLVDGGLVVLHLGISKKCDMGKRLSEIANDHFDILDLYTESVEHCESHGIRDKGSVTGHQYLILKKVS